MNFKVFSCCFQIAGSSLPFRFYTSRRCLPSHSSSQLPPSTKMTTPMLSFCPSSVFFCPARPSHLLGRKLDQGKGCSHFSAVLYCIDAYNRTWHIAGTRYVLKEQRGTIVYLLFWRFILWFRCVFILYILFYKYECLAYMYICVSHICLVPSKVRRGMSGPQELELQLAVSCHIGDRSWAWVLWPLDHLSSASVCNEHQSAGAMETTAGAGFTGWWTWELNPGPLPEHCVL